MTFGGKIAPQAWMIAEETEKVMAALNGDGAETRFVGGCVRDALCNRKVVDIDLATTLKPEDVIARLVKNGINYAPTGLKHGTVTAIVHGKPFEVTTLRVDVTPFGRHAEVRYTDDWKTDAARRDFTINAMSATLSGDVYDPFGGITDLKEGRVIFVGDPEKRIHEDNLRILRFFRFHAHFGKGPPDGAALRACAKDASLLSRLSAERVRQEVLKLLTADTAAQVWRIMLQAGISTHILPEATAADVLQNLVDIEKRHHSDLHPLRRLSALLVVNAEGLSHVADSLRLSNAQKDLLQKMTFPAFGTQNVKALVYRTGNDMARSLLLLEAAKQGEKDDFDARYALATSFRPPRFPVEGNDILKAGIKPGPAVGQTLKAVEDWWIEQDFAPGRTECLARLKALAAG